MKQKVKIRISHIKELDKYFINPQQDIQTKILKTCKDSLYLQYANLFKSSIKFIEICPVEVTTRDKRKISSFVPFFLPVTYCLPDKYS